MTKPDVSIPTGEGSEKGQELLRQGKPVRGVPGVDMAPAPGCGTVIALASIIAGAIFMALHLAVFGLQ